MCAPGIPLGFCLASASPALPLYRPARVRAARVAHATRAARVAHARVRRRACVRPTTLFGFCLAPRRGPATASPATSALPRPRARHARCSRRARARASPRMRATNDAPVVRSCRQERSEINMMNTTMSEMSKASEITTTSEKHIQTSGCVCAPANCEPKRPRECAPLVPAPPMRSGALASTPRASTSRALATARAAQATATALAIPRADRLIASVSRPQLAADDACSYRHRQ